jgi:hypothetical protein
MVTIRANGGNPENMELSECIQLVEYWTYIDKIEYKFEHPSPKFRVIPFHEWQGMN